MKQVMKLKDQVMKHNVQMMKEEENVVDVEDLVVEIVQEIEDDRDQEGLKVILILIQIMKEKLGLKVKVKEIDNMGRVNLSMKALLPRPERPEGDRPPRGDDNRGGSRPPRRDDRRR